MAVLDGELRIKIGKNAKLIAGAKGIFITASIPAGSISLKLVRIDSKHVVFKVTKKGLMKLVPEKMILSRIRAMNFNAEPSGKGVIRIPVSDFMLAHGWQIEGELRID